MDEASWIQISYPSTEPDWPEVADDTLLQLVREHEEPNCAGLALAELRSRKHPAVEELCLLLIRSPHADQWLQASAISSLLSINPMKGFEIALDMVDHCAASPLAIIIEEASYGYDSELRDSLLQHPLIPRLMLRLQDPAMRELPFADLFLARFS